MDLTYASMLLVVVASDQSTTSLNSESSGASAANEPAVDIRIENENENENENEVDKESCFSRKKLVGNLGCPSPKTSSSSGGSGFWHGSTLGVGQCFFGSQGSIGDVSETNSTDSFADSDDYYCLDGPHGGKGLVLDSPSASIFDPDGFSYGTLSGDLSYWPGAADGFTPLRVLVQDFKFRPEEVTVEAGTFVQFSVKGNATHKLSCEGAFLDIMFDGIKSNFVHKFGTPGKFVVKNDVFSFMTCVIHVTAAAAVTATTTATATAIAIATAGKDESEGEYYDHYQDPYYGYVPLEDDIEMQAVYPCQKKKDEVGSERSGFPISTAGSGAGSGAGGSEAGASSRSISMSSKLNSGNNVNTNTNTNTNINININAKMDSDSLAGERLKN